MTDKQNKLKLTMDLVSNLEPTEKEYAVWDTKIDGLHVRVLPSGSKSFAILYRDQRRKQRRRVLGKVSTTNLEKARRQAQAFLADLSRGHDQFEAAHRLRTIPKLEAVWERYLSDYAEPKKAARSVLSDRTIWKSQISTTFAKSHIDEITRQRVRAWHASMDQTPYQANRAIALLSKLISFAEIEGISNPCKGVTRYPEHTRISILTLAERRRLLAAIRGDHDTGARVAIELILFTGARLGECLKSKWGEFDLERMIWNVPKDHIKGGNRHSLTIVRPLSPTVADLLNGWRRQTANGSDDFLIPSPIYANRRRHDLKSSWDRIRKVSELPTLRIHDLRHNYATLALSKGATLAEIGRVLGHRDHKTTLKYAHYTDETGHRIASLVDDGMI